MHRPGEPLPAKSIRQESVILHLKSEEENFTLRKHDDETSLQHTLLSSCLFKVDGRRVRGLQNRFGTVFAIFTMKPAAFPYRRPSRQNMLRRGYSDRLTPLRSLSTSGRKERKKVGALGELGLLPLALFVDGVFIRGRHASKSRKNAGGILSSKEEND